MPEPRGRARVLIAGVTTRPLAISAVRAGYRVAAIDAFGDLDLRAAAEVIVVPPHQSNLRYAPFAAAAAGARVPAELVAYTSNFENHPAAVSRLAARRRLLGNSPATLARVRNPFELSRILRRNGFPAPECRSQPHRRRPTGPWLLKPRRSGGGHGVLPWNEGDPVPRGMYLQKMIAGAPGSISFAADGTNARVLGFSRQLVGDPRFGADGFRYCGSILGSPGISLFQGQEQLLEQASRLIAILTEEFGLRGLNGVDFIANHGTPYTIEVNPRYSASMELIERATDVSMFEFHARASTGELPSWPDAGGPLLGKAIVYARHDCLVGNSREWLREDWLADIPYSGALIRQRRPICTVFAEGRTAQACIRQLARRASAIYRAVRLVRSDAA